MTRDVYLIGALVLFGVFLLGSFALGATGHADGVLLTEDEFREVVEMQQVTVPLLQGEIDALKQELAGAQAVIAEVSDRLAWCEAQNSKPLRQPAVNLLGGFAACTAVGMAYCK